MEKMRFEQFEQFADAVKAGMEARYPDSEVELRRVSKNNGVVYTGITIRNEDEHIYPTMYLERFYDRYEGYLTDEVMDVMCNVYERSRINTELKGFDDYDQVKNRLRCRLINYEANKVMLVDVPYRRFMDLAIVPYCVVDGLMSNSIGEASFRIKKQLLDLWDITEEQLLDVCIENTFKHEKPMIMCMYDALHSLNPSATERNEEKIKSCPLYVMSTGNAYGATSMMFEDELKRFCEEIDNDIIIIPSSINEVLIVPNDGIDSTYWIDAMIRDVNETTLEAVDVLSDHAYYYNRVTGYQMSAA